MSVADNFDKDLPLNSRKDLMSLDTINSNDAKIHPFKKLDTQRDWSANLYNLDIDKSSPAKINIYTNKPDFTVKVDDIEKTNSKILHYPLNRPEFNLTNADIEKSTPKPNMGYFYTKRCTNPLEPKYNLPKVEPFPDKIPKFIRDQINIADIRGAKPSPYFKFQARETFPLDNYGIEGTKPKKRYVRTTPYDNIDYSDLTRDIFKTKRHTNPLDPVYELKYKNGENYIHGMIEKSKPASYYPYRYPDPFALKVEDIIGAQAGTKNRINKFNGQNFELNVKDIKGTTAGSLKKGIVTQRNVNPLDPKYQFLGRTELKDINNDPYAKTATQFRPKEENKKQRNSMSAKPIISKPSSHHSSKVATPASNHEENNNYNTNECKKTYKHSLAKTEMNGFNMPDPYYGLIHDKYVCSSENPDKGKELEKKKENDAFFRATNSGFSAYNKINGSSNDSKSFNFKPSSARNCFSAVGNRGLSYAQKLDKFMESHNLNYIGEKNKVILKS